MKFNLAVRKLRIVKESYLISFLLQDFDSCLSDIFKKHLQLNESRNRLKGTYFDICTRKGFELLKSSLCSSPSKSSGVAGRLELIGRGRAI